MLGAARPLADVLWMRETEAASFDTPERRAAFETRLAEVTAMIGDEAVRKYYRRDFGERLRRQFDIDERPLRRQRHPRTGNTDWPTASRAGRLSAMHRRQRGVRNRLRACSPASAMWRRARSLPRAPFIAAAAPPSLRARRSSCRW